MKSNDLSSIIKIPDAREIFSNKSHNYKVLISSDQTYKLAIQNNALR